MRKCTSLGGLVIILGLLSSLWWWRQAHAQVDAFTFFIPFRSDELARQFAQGRSDFDAFINADIEVTISVSVLSDNTVIYYDHWEDGLEPTLTSPNQASTEVWGDNDPSNGIPPGFTSDNFSAGSVISLNNDVLVPRTDPPNQIYFDGGDKLTAVGGAMAVSMAAWPIREPPRPDGGEVRILYADAWELYTTGRWGDEYIVPIGENLASARAGFTVVGVNVQAAEDDTVVELDLDADGTFENSVVLAEGQQYHVPTGVIAGATIRSSNPIQVHIAASDPVRTYEMRGYTLVPVDQWTNDYLAPRTSDGDLWFYNRHNSELVLTLTTFTTTVNLTIPPQSAGEYPASGLLPRTGIHIVAPDGRSFTALAALDADSAQDWGYALLPTANLSTQALIGWGLGNYNRPPGPGNGGDGTESRLYVTALEETTLHIDYDNDGVVDATADVEPLEEVFVIDPQDFDMTGALVFTTNKVPFAAVWGQDQTANPAQPSIDAGTTIVPIAALDIQKTFALVGDADCNDIITPGDLVRFNLRYNNNTAISTPDDVLVRDQLPPELIYIPGSTRLNGVTLADAPNGTPFLLDDSGLNVGILPPRGSGTIIYDVMISETATSAVFNQAEISVPATLQVFDAARVRVPIQDQALPILEFDKTLLAPPLGNISSGQVLTFGLTITNTSSQTVVNLPVRDSFDPTELTFLQAVPPPDLTASGAITWNNLLGSLGLSELPPNSTVNSTIIFEVNSLPTATTAITNEVDLIGVRRTGNTRPLFCSTYISLPVEAPSPTPTATPTDDDGDDDDDDGTTPSPTDTPPGTATATPDAGSPTSTPGTGTPTTGTPGVEPPDTATPRLGTPGNGTPGAELPPGAEGEVPPPTSTILPVNLLPETGARESEGAGLISIFLLILVMLGTGSLVYLSRQKK